MGTKALNRLHVVIAFSKVHPKNCMELLEVLRKFIGRAISLNNRKLIGRVVRAASRKGQRLTIMLALVARINDSVCFLTASCFIINSRSAE